MTGTPLKHRQVSNLPAIQRFSEIAQEALKRIPDTLQEHAQRVNIVVENYADRDTLNSLHIEDKYELLGLYRGTPLPIKAVFAQSSLPDHIFLYRCPLIRYAHENNECIEALVKHVIMHELGHHFGYTPA